VLVFQREPIPDESVARNKFEGVALNLVVFSYSFRLL